MLKSRQLEIGAIGLPVEWRGTDEQFLSGLEKLPAPPRLSDAHAAVHTFFLPPMHTRHFMALATTRLRACANILGHTEFDWP